MCGSLNGVDITEGKDCCRLTQVLSLLSDSKIYVCAQVSSLDTEENLQLRWVMNGERSLVVLRINWMEATCFCDSVIALN